MEEAAVEEEERLLVTIVLAVGEGDGPAGPVVIDKLQSHQLPHHLHHQKGLDLQQGRKRKLSLEEEEEVVVLEARGRLLHWESEKKRLI